MDEKKSERPEEGDAKENHGIFERIVKKSIETGIGAFSRSEDSVRGLIDQMKLPKEAAHVILEQVDETKKGLYTVVAKEIREFLQTTNFATDIKKILTGLAFEVKMEVRFKSVESDQGDATVRPDVSANVALKTQTEARPSRRPPPPAKKPSSDEE